MLRQFSENQERLNRRRKNRSNKQKTNKIIDLNQNMPMIMLNENDPCTSIKNNYWDGEKTHKQLFVVYKKLIQI